ncbi:protease pro-enzyme activation domain-containing protein [uncultured Jatrophihabitans sp.]|uniref:S53 family peptidase n=1 Tax=uncultured Jatrophihabitans sp. TaxID=1610747 RepID=UPI0035CB46AF
MSANSLTKRHAGVAAVTVALLGAAAAVTALPSGAGAASWSPTATKALNLKNATLLGHASSTTPLRITVGLTPRDRSGLNTLIKQQSTPGNAQFEKFLTPAQFTSRFAATSATATAVSKYLTSAGLTNVTVAANRLQVTANATVASAEKAFDTSISSYRQQGKTVLANTAAAQVPSSLANSVSAVLGLSSLGMSSPLPPVTAPNLNGFYPKEFNTVYDSWGTKPGTGTGLAVIAEGDLTSTVKDLRTAENAQQLPQVPVSLRYAGIHSPDTSGADEWDLDTQTSTGIAPNVKQLDIYIATSLTDSDLARAINLFVTEKRDQAGSASLGECDALASLDGSTTIDDIAFAQAAVQGQTFFASSGDTGSSCAVLPTNGAPGSGPTDTEYPASSPYVTGVGGTTLDASSTDAYGTEVAWNAGGGGISPIEAQPFWQNGVAPVSTPVTSLRGVPDVAFDADPTTGGNIYVDGAPEEIGGTSLASPLALGLWTRINASHSGKLGFAPPKLYALYKTAQGSSVTPPTAVPGFHDITVGANGLYTALPGYDYTTGLGSWDVGKLDVAIK